MNPLEALQMWSDDPRFPAVLHELHPSRAGAIGVGENADEALVCMAALAAIASHRELLIAGIDWHGERVLAIADLVHAVAEATQIKTASGSGTWWRFAREEVTA